jgi:hypothetical protein
MNITSEVKEIILQLPKNQLFNSREIYERYFIDFCMESTYSKIINRMQKDELIYMLQKGIFYLPKYRNGKRINIRQYQIKSFVFSNNNDGTLVGDGLYYRLKLSKVIAKEYLYYTNRIDELSKKIGNARFLFLPFDFDPTTTSIIQLMDILCGFHKIANLDLDQFHQFLDSSVKLYDDIAFYEIHKIMKYPKHVIAFLKTILDHFGIDNVLERYLSTRSIYKIPDWK